MKVRIAYRVEEEIEVSDEFKILDGFSKCNLTEDEENTIVKCLDYAPAVSALQDKLFRECSEIAGNGIDTIYSMDGYVLYEDYED